jgi:hypothetical protein
VQRDPAARQRVLLYEEGETPSSSRPLERMLCDDGVNGFVFSVTERRKIELGW